MPHATHGSRFAGWSTRLRERLARSSRVFLLGVLIACGIEVLVDWHSTLFEITVLRDRVRQRGQSYVAVLAKAGAPALGERNARELERLSTGVLDDPDVVYVRFVDRSENVVFERAVEPYRAELIKERGAPFDRLYARQLERDLHGILEDPEGLRDRMEHSRHRDFAQAYGDLVRAVVARVTKPEPPPRSTTASLYQDRLYDERTATHDRDATVTYALGRVEGGGPERGGRETGGRQEEGADPIGAVVVAFRMDATNDAIRGKYLKGMGIVVFFVGLILAQNVAARREKLRLLDLEARHLAAKEALRAALPEPCEGAGLRSSGALSQAAGTVDGAIWDQSIRDGVLDLLVLDPQGDGVAAAAIALHARSVWRRRRASRTTATLAEEAAALGEAALQIPLTHAIGLLLVRVRGGRVEALGGDIGGVRVVAGGSARPLVEQAVDDTPAGVAGPLRSLSGELCEGSMLLVATDGVVTSARRLDVDQLAAFVARAGAVAGAGKDGGASTRAADAVAWARGKHPQLAQSDLIVIVVERT